MFSRCPISTYCTYRGRLCVIVVVCTTRGKRCNIALTARTSRGIGIAVITIAIVTQCGKRTQLLTHWTVGRGIRHRYCLRVQHVILGICK